MSTTASDATRTTTNSGTGTSTGSGTTAGSSGTSGVTDRAREKAGSAYSAARDRTSNAYSSARDTARTATQRTSDRIDSNPVAALIGGLALGGLVAWLLPKTQRETEALGSVGEKITDTARQAAQTAFDAGKQQVAEIKDNAATKVGQAVIDAVSTATTGNGNQEQ
jgi:ElaB/YqjD/DUF883 family membrane-anchored ribosome-binding protein